MAQRCTPRSWRFSLPLRIFRKSKKALELNYAPAYSDGYRLGSIVRSELFHDVLNMSFDSLFRDKQKRSYVTISVSSSYLLENIDFAFA